MQTFKQPGSNAMTTSYQKIYQTNDFDKFSLIKGNRKVYPQHVEDLEASLLRNNTLHENAIKVYEKNDKLYILDGQHRFKACKNLNIPIPYYIVEEPEKFSIIDHQIQKKWELIDYLGYYISEKKREYIKFNDLSKKYKIPFGVMFTLLSTRRYDAGKIFRKGEMEIDFRIEEFLGKTYEFLEKFRIKYENTKNSIINRRDFVTAIYWFFRSYPEDIYKEMLEKLDRVSSTIREKDCSENYRDFLILVYNKGKNDKQKISRKQKIDD